MQEATLGFGFVGLQQLGVLGPAQQASAPKVSACQLYMHGMAKLIFSCSRSHLHRHCVARPSARRPEALSCTLKRDGGLETCLMVKEDVEAVKAAEEQHAGQDGAEGERPPRKKGKVSPGLQAKDDAGLKPRRAARQGLPPLPAAVRRRCCLPPVAQRPHMDVGSCPSPFATNAAQERQAVGPRWHRPLEG